MAAAGQRVAIVGAGIVGCSCALFLQRDGHEVTLLDPRAPGGGASSGNAGVISSSSVLPVGTPGIFMDSLRMLTDPLSPLALRWRHLPSLLPWLTRFLLASRHSRLPALSTAIAALTGLADQAHDIVIQQCGLADLVHGGGWLKVAYDRTRFEQGTHLERAHLERHDYPYELLDGRECRELEPALSSEVAAGLLLPGVRAVRQPQHYTAGIARTVLERGGRHLRAQVTGLEQSGGLVRAVATDQGRIEADLVVIAAGAFSGRLAGQGGASVPLVAERGYHLMLPHPTPPLTRPIYTLEGGFVLAPMDHGLRLTGGVELASNDAPPDDRRTRRLIAPAQRLVPSLSDRTASSWQGHRPSLPDSLPVIGQAPRAANLWLAFGHQHIGLTLGPLTGRLLADLVAGRAPGLDMAPFRPDRRFS